MNGWFGAFPPNVGSWSTFEIGLSKMVAALPTFRGISEQPVLVRHFGKLADGNQSEPAIRLRGCDGSQVAPVELLLRAKRGAIKKRAASAHSISASARKRSNQVQKYLHPNPTARTIQKRQPCTRGMSSTRTTASVRRLSRNAVAHPTPASKPQARPSTSIVTLPRRPL